MLDTNFKRINTVHFAGKSVNCGLLEISKRSSWLDRDLFGVPQTVQHHRGGFLGGL